MATGALQFNNPFAQPKNAIKATPAVRPYQGGASVSSTKQVSSSNPFAPVVASSPTFQGNTYGVNANIGIGDDSYIAAQAGYKAGIGRTLAFA